MTANTGRADRDRLFHAVHIPDSEPLFHMRARDPAAFAGALAYAAEARRIGVPIAVVEQALQQADRLAAFGPKQVPDARHLEPHEIKQLEYQFSRRAWRTRPTDAPSVEILLAERRGYDQAMTEIRAARAPERIP